MKNKVTGLYEATKFINATGAVITGTGETQAQAREDLKKKLKAYREQPLVPSGEEVRSPGFVTSTENGRVRYHFNNERKARVLVRPSLLKFEK